MLKVLDLFSGIGGFSLGLERTGGFETVAFCEIEPFPRRVLAKHWPEVPCYDDVRNLTAERIAADGIAANVICGGFPCQDISTAGKKIGITGERSGLWREFARLVGEIRPSYVCVENSAALLARGMDTVLGDLARHGYDAVWAVIPASLLGAWHERERVWIVAYANDESESVSAEYDEARGVPQDDEFIHAKRRQLQMALLMAGTWRQQQSLPWHRVWQGEDSPVGMGMDDGFPERLDQLRALGNAVVPQIPELIGRAILEAESCNA